MQIDSAEVGGSVGLPVSPDSKRGRKPDPELLNRIYRTTLEVYAEVGWKAFTIDAVATAGKIGKAAIYSRWDSKQDLLVASLEQAAPEFESILPNGDSFRENLVIYIDNLVAAFDGPLAMVVVRAQLDSKVYPDLLGAALERVRILWQQAAEKAVESAILSGQIPADTRSAMVFDALRGMVLNRYLLGAQKPLPQETDARRRYAERVVDFVLAGIAGARTFRK